MARKHTICVAPSGTGKKLGASCAVLHHLLHQLAEPAEISVLLLTSGVGDGPDNGKTGQMHVPMYAGIMAHEMCRYLKYLPLIKVWPVFQKENSLKELASARIVCATVEMAHRLWRAGKLKLDKLKHLILVPMLFDLNYMETSFEHLKQVRAQPVTLLANGQL
jgi:hypothetical protein